MTRKKGREVSKESHHKAKIERAQAKERRMKIKTNARLMRKRLMAKALASKAHVAGTNRAHAIIKKAAAALQGQGGMTSKEAMKATKKAVGAALKRKMAAHKKKVKKIKAVVKKLKASEGLLKKKTKKHQPYSAEAATTTPPWAKRPPVAVRVHKIAVKAAKMAVKKEESKRLKASAKSHTVDGLLKKAVAKKALTPKKALTKAHAAVKHAAKKKKKTVKKAAKKKAVKKAVKKAKAKAKAKKKRAVKKKVVRTVATISHAAGHSLTKAIKHQEVVKDQHSLAKGIINSASVKKTKKPVIMAKHKKLAMTASSEHMKVGSLRKAEAAIAAPKELTAEKAKVFRSIQHEEDAVIAKVMAQSSNRQLPRSSGEWEDPTAELVEQPPKQGKKSSTPATDLFDTELSTMQVAMSGKELAAAVREAVAHEYRNHKKPAHTAPPPHPAAASNAEFLVEPQEFGPWLLN